jgi:hypothetical protein
VVFSVTMPRSALDELLGIARVEKPAADDVSFSGAEPVFPTRYRVGSAGAAALAAAGIAAADLWSLRTGRPRQRISVDIRAATASLAAAVTCA